MEKKTMHFMKMVVVRVPFYYNLYMDKKLSNVAVKMMALYELQARLQLSFIFNPKAF